jgi:Tfp pilus assembly protein PilF
VLKFINALAANAITQHKFRLAKEYVEKALALEDKKAASLMMLTDVSLELGDYATARRTLQQFKTRTHLRI